MRAIELYDHRHDPRESVNIAADPEYLDVVLRLGDMLDRTFAPPFPVPER